MTGLPSDHLALAELDGDGQRLLLRDLRLRRKEPRHEFALLSRICPPYQMLFRPGRGIEVVPHPRTLEVRRLLVVNKHDRPAEARSELAVAVGPTTSVAAIASAPARSTIERLRIYLLHPNGSFTHDRGRQRYVDRSAARQPFPAVMFRSIPSPSPVVKCRIVLYDVSQTFRLGGRMDIQGMFPRKDAKQRPADAIAAAEDAGQLALQAARRSTTLSAVGGTPSTETRPIGPRLSSAAATGARRAVEELRGGDDAVRAALGEASRKRSSGSPAAPSRTWTRTASPKLPSRISKASAHASRGGRRAEGSRTASRYGASASRVFRTPSVTVGLA